MSGAPVQQPTKELVRALAAANGLNIPDERLELVLRQYESFLRSLEAINSLPLAAEVEPAIVFSLQAQPAVVPATRREE
jgi:hypothetical protein